MHSADFYLDSGASQHSGNSPSVFVSLAKLGMPVSIKGIGADNLSCDESGELNVLSNIGSSDFPSMVHGLYMNNSSFNLISLGMLLIRGVKLVGDSTSLTLTLVVNGDVYMNISPVVPGLNVYKATLTNGKLFFKVGKQDELSKSFSAVSLLDEHLALNSVPTRERKNFSKNELDRASIALDYHLNNMHPGDTAMHHAAVLRVAGEMTVSDVRLMYEVYGRCPFCDLAKIRKETLPIVHSASPSKFGQVLYIDIRSLDVLRSTEVEAILVCGYSGHISLVKCDNKVASTLFESITKHLKSHFVTFGHLTERIHCDAESTLKATRSLFSTINIEVTDSAPASHCATAERMIRLLDERALATLLTLKLKWKRSLSFYLHRATAYYINMSPNSHTYTMLEPSRLYEYYLSEYICLSRRLCIHK